MCTSTFWCSLLKQLPPEGFHFQFAIFTGRGEHPRFRWTTRSDPFMWKANLSASWRASKRGHHCLQLQSPCQFFLGVKSPWKLKNSIKGWRIRPASVIFYIQTQNGIHNEIIWNNSALQQHYIWMKTNIKKLTILNIYWLWNLPSSFSLRLLPGWWPYYRPNSKAHRQDHM